MKLHGFHGQRAMPQSHDDAVFGFSGHLKTRREGIAHGEQRMIAAYLETFRQSFKNPHAGMSHPRRLAMHGVIQHAQSAAKRLHYAL